MLNLPVFAAFVPLYRLLSRPLVVVSSRGGHVVSSRGGRVVSSRGGHVVVVFVALCRGGRRGRTRSLGGGGGVVVGFLRAVQKHRVCDQREPQPRADVEQPRFVLFLHLALFENVSEPLELFLDVLDRVVLQHTAAVVAVADFRAHLVRVRGRRVRLPFDSGRPPPPVRLAVVGRRPVEHAKQRLLLAVARVSRPHVVHAVRFRRTYAQQLGHVVLTSGRRFHFSTGGGFRV